MKFVGIRTTRFLYRLKKSLNMIKTCAMRVLCRNFLALAVNCDFYGQRPSANIAVLRVAIGVRSKFTRILSYSVKWLFPKNGPFGYKHSLPNANSPNKFVTASGTHQRPPRGEMDLHPGGSMDWALSLARPE